MTKAGHDSDVETIVALACGVDNEGIRTGKSDKAENGVL
jgi:hypothetical protein